MTNSYRLRQRAINVLYLVILAYIFLVVPASFMDAIFRSNQSFEHITAESDKLLQLKANYFLNVLKKEDSTLFAATSNKVREIELNEAMLQQYIDSLKDGLIKHTGLTKTGFYKNGKETSVINKWMIRYNTGNMLLQRLQQFNEAIRKALPESGIKLTDSIINTGPVQLTHNGTAKPFLDFYFHNTPFNVAIIHLTSFQAEVRSAVSTVYDELFNNVRMEYREKYGHALAGDYLNDQYLG